MSQKAKYGVILLSLVLVLFGCSTENRQTRATKSAGHFVKFVETGDTLHLNGFFADSALRLMSQVDMLATMNDFPNLFGKLVGITDQEFSTDSTVNIILRYEHISLLASLEFNEMGKIRFLGIQPEPVEPAVHRNLAANVYDIRDLDSFVTVFNADSEYVRLLTILSPT